MIKKGKHRLAKESRTTSEIFPLVILSSERAHTKGVFTPLRGEKTSFLVIFRHFSAIFRWNGLKF